ncbi:hypothetical protein DPMN_026843 [Dreissena polymorpha]|uniref:Uncharacterized protein n=1 Tax=Dreissena polymorpha TaxID=45954 RepID=A0A9D4LS16_DREPO|nr:hypothetical protein DPMN_026843 [Dreissena polymorpha]
MPCPEMPDEWKNIAKQFGDRWQLHNCVNASDGKHIAIHIVLGVMSPCATTT